MLEKKCSEGKKGTQAVIIFLLVLIITVPSFALKVGDVVVYHGKNYIVAKITDTQVELCPSYNYQQFFYKADWGWFYGDRCVFVPKSIFAKEKKGKKNQVKRPLVPKNPQNKQKKESVKHLLQLATNPKYLNSLTATQFRRLYKKITSLAVMHPTQQRLKAYVYMTNFLRLKALVFAHSVMDYYMAHSKYYILKQMGETSWSRKVEMAELRLKGKNLIKQHKNNIGVMAFVKDGCPFCEKQIPVLQWLHADYGIDVLLVSMNDCGFSAALPCIVKPSAFRYFGVQSIPTMMLVIRTPEGPKGFPIGVGLTDEMTLFQRITYYLNGYYHHDLYTDKNFLKLLSEGK